MDAFYASVELLRYPQLRGLPLVIGGSGRYRPTRLADGTQAFARLRDYAGRGVITTSTYEARALGVHSAMGMARAARLAPDAVLLPCDFDEYRRYSARFKAAVRALTPMVEDRGIDEIYIDLSDVPGVAADGGRAIGLALKSAVMQATGLSCSIGIAPNKLLAKLCSEFDKPDGLTILTRDDVPARVWPLPAKRINGVGPKTTQRLAALGLHTIGEVAAADVGWLCAQFGGNYGTWLHQSAHGVDARPVVTVREPKSISRETTFERDLHVRSDRTELGRIFTTLCVQLAADLDRKGYAGRTIGVKLRFDDFRTVTRERTLPTPVAGAREIRQAAGLCLKRVEFNRRLRLLGVRAGSLVPVTQAPPVLIPTPCRQNGQNSGIRATLMTHATTVSGRPKRT